MSDNNQSSESSGDLKKHSPTGSNGSLGPPPGFSHPTQFQSGAPVDNGDYDSGSGSRKVSGSKLDKVRQNYYANQLNTSGNANPAAFRESADMSEWEKYGRLPDAPNYYEKPPVPAGDNNRESTGGSVPWRRRSSEKLGSKDNLRVETSANPARSSGFQKSPRYDGSFFRRSNNGKKRSPTEKNYSVTKGEPPQGAWRDLSARKTDDPPSESSIPVSAGEATNNNPEQKGLQFVEDVVYKIPQQGTGLDVPQDGSGLTRKKSMVKIERSRSIHGYRKLQSMGIQAPLPRPDRMISSNGSCQRIWSVVAYALTCWLVTLDFLFLQTHFFSIPSFYLIKVLKMEDRGIRQAWREKVALCLIAFFNCVALGFFTFFFQRTFCPDRSGSMIKAAQYYSKTIGTNSIAVYGKAYDVENFWFKHPSFPVPSTQVLSALANTDASYMFPIDNPDCAEFTPPAPNCAEGLFGDVLGQLGQGKCHTVDQLAKAGIPSKDIIFEWDEIAAEKDYYLVYGNSVLNMKPYILASSRSKVFGQDAHDLITNGLRRDATILFSKSETGRRLGSCLKSKYQIGSVELETALCVAANAVLNISLVIIGGLVLVRFALAMLFSWVLSRQLGKIQEMNLSFFKKSNDKSAVHAPGTGVTAATHPQSFTLFHQVSFAEHYKELYTICLVTCYSEGESGLRTTLDSLAQTDYHDHYKCIFLVADGIVQGAGNPKPTGQIILDMIELDPVMHGPIEKVTEFDAKKQQNVQRVVCRNAEAQSYAAVGQGSKRHNMAKVYCGTYLSNGKRVATILIEKCGTPAESSSAKPGNRGKRDSQIVLMDFLSKCTFDEPMSPFQYDLFTKMTHIMTVQNGGTKKVTPDMFEIVLMVDADTKVMSDSLSHMIAVMQRDPSVMGLCGETRIMNKNETWVTLIQVFEYHISHHLAKSFESVFGGVTCLPGCFCMYRIKSPKPLPVDMRNRVRNPEEKCDWVPILANPDIVLDYSESDVDTLHKKNLLLLGEDRYLSTLMLRTFPKRKMMFVPKAICKTQVPAEFQVLLSQRRRWINSTIHNLMELVLVNELCGTFCFSMQFVVFLELIGTITLPAAIVFTTVVIVSSIIGPVATIPLLLLAGILGLPAFLILFTSARLVYIIYMIIYLFALPIWNFVLPVYAFWHFDDFSWGQTRQVAGEKKGGDSHGHGGGEESSNVLDFPAHRWAEWEKARLAELRSRNELDPVGAILDTSDINSLIMKTVVSRKKTGKLAAISSQVSSRPSSAIGEDGVRTPMKSARPASAMTDAQSTQYQSVYETAMQSALPSRPASATTPSIRSRPAQNVLSQNQFDVLSKLQEDQ